MKANLRKLLGADRPKIVVVVSITRITAEQSLQPVKTKLARDYPVWCFCVEPCAPVPGFDRFASGVDASVIERELHGYWPSLVVVSWAGEKGYSWIKLRSCLRPPFRLVFINESGDLFSSPRHILAHSFRRLSETSGNVTQRIKDVGGGIRTASYWKVYHAADWSWSALRALFRHIYFRLKDWILAALVSAFSSVAQLSTPAERRRFKLLGAKASSALDLPPLRNVSWIEISLQGRQWNAAEIGRVLRGSEVAVVVFREQGETADADALLALFTPPAVFAAALQVQHTDWRTKLLPKFPFRQLQPGEVCRTLAPYSSLIAVRRDALLHFGIPPVSSCGSAYLVACWQAAAAGLECYTVGSARSAIQEIDVPSDHAEFLRVVLRNKELRQLRPADPDLSRGNIATWPVHRRASPGKTRVLIVSPYLPYPLAHGGAVRMFNLCRAMARNVDFTLVCFRESLDRVDYGALGGVFRDVFVVDNDEKHRGETDVPRQVSGYRNTAMAAIVRHLCDTRDIDVVQIEYTQMAEYRSCVGARPVVLVEHDVTFTLHRQIWQTRRTRESAREYRNWLHFEGKALREVDCVWAMSGHDRDVILEQGAAAKRTVVVPNGVDLRRFTPERNPLEDLTDRTPQVLFIGAFRHLPNLLAFEALRNRIMPAVWRVLPKVQLHVVAGMQHERHAMLAGKSKLLDHDDRIRIQGFVDDVRPAYRDAQVVAIPLPVSAGTNIKLMEAMACGRAVVSTPIGCIGLDLIDGVDIFIGELENGFADAVIELLHDAAMRERMGKQARKTAEERFGWDSIATHALRSYDSLLQPADAATA